MKLCLVAFFGIFAGVFFDDATAQQKSGFDLTLEKAMELYEAGGVEAAIQIYQSLREDRPNDARLLHELSKSSLAVKDFPGCIEYARSSAAEESKYQADAFGVLARCELEGGSAAQSLATYLTALELHPESASLHFDYGQALQTTGDIAAADTQFALALERAAEQPSLFLAYGNMLGASSEAAALLMNLRYIMAAPQSPLTVGAAEQILTLMTEDSPVSAPNYAANVFDWAFLAARLATRPSDGEAISDADRLSRFLQQFVLNIVNAADPAVTGSVLWASAIEPMLAMAEHDVLDTYLYFVAALARTEGSPEWLSAHRQKFERLVEYLARTDTTS